MMWAAWIGGSVIYRIYARLAALWGRSLTKRALFSAFGLDEGFDNGALGRALNALSKLGERSSAACARGFRGSLIGAAARRVSEAARSVSIMGVNIAGALKASAIGKAAAYVKSLGASGCALALTLFAAPLVPTKYVLAAGVAIGVLFFADVFVTGRTVLRFKPIDALVLLFALTVCASLVISYNRRASAPVALVYLLFIIMYFAARNTFAGSPAKIKAAVWAFLAGGLCVSLIGCYQKLTGQFIATDSWIDADMFGEAANRVYSSLDNPNVLGEYLLFVIPLALAALYLVGGKRAGKPGVINPVWAKVIPLGILCAAILCMVFTNSRGAWLGLIAALALFALLNDKKLVFLGIIVLLLLPALLPQQIIERFLSIGNTQDSSTNYRVNIWLASIMMIKRFWPSGIGLGTETFVHIYGLYAFNAVFAPHSHNLYLQLIIDLGACGLASFIVIMLVCFKSLLIGTDRKTENGRGFVKPVSAALAAGFAGFLLQGLTDNAWYNYRVVCVFWLLLAIGARLKDCEI